MGAAAPTPGEGRSGPGTRPGWWGACGARISPVGPGPAFAGRLRRSGPGRWVVGPAGARRRRAGVPGRVRPWPARGAPRRPPPRCASPRRPGRRRP
ncbi:hypothetical protein D8771_32405 [Streptomyces albus]|uniref:Uncharacterized protein n=1 Tax=Streptomyces albus TaxID=1888 RepID=A0A8H1L479_9ACTN|nr:hypothetical protein D8771_32405 [Streptomyces albus]